MDATVSVIVPVYRGGEAFRSCLSSLAGVRPGPLEIIVVTDGDPGDSGRVAEAFGARVLQLPDRRGPARARNAGARESRGELLLFIDADVRVPSDIVAQVVEAFANEPGLAALFGSYDQEPGQPNFLSQYKNLLHHYVHQTAREDASTFWGACGAIRRRVFLHLGGFDERYSRPCVEDIELGYRVKRAGGRIRLMKALQVQHLKRWGAISLLRSDILDRGVPWTRLILRDRRFVNDLNVGRSGRASVVLAYLLMLCLAGSWWNTELLIAAGVAALSLLALNASLYRFFWRQRGFSFVLPSVLWHWLYFLYSGLAFAAGVILHLLSGSKRRAAARPDEGHAGAKRNREPEHD